MVGPSILSFITLLIVPNRLALSEYVFTTGELDFLLSFISSRKQLRNKVLSCQCDNIYSLYAVGTFISK